MAYAIILSPDAARDLRAPRAYDRAVVREALETHLRHNPEKVSRSRIKRLQGVSKPQYRLRVGDFRVFYDVMDDEVRILAIVAKPHADEWLRQAALPDEESPSLGNQE